ncbi:hypothetical protein DYD83_02270 [Dickeya fangzhongdai]|uniref:Uncharacterized protein n=1 Tax=Dickeya fangzhongdai TaxID=1778540 RepID=A0A2K8QHC2_9GAMM|nr:hypothetical protein CVE23_02240 [Dickeya fangzhongdai]QOH46327.1 hypothetical protein DYD82_02265 [Dickeya fangzhongdai]QOH50634.1 hypothetical protein DYD83_02270 [Dickeya fangzhongdai]
MVALVSIIGIVGIKEVNVIKLMIESVNVNMVLLTMLLLILDINCMPGRNEIVEKAMKSIRMNRS